MSNYTVGRAVVYRCPDFNGLLFVTGQSKWENEMEAEDIKGNYQTLCLLQTDETSSRPATEEEILAECAKNGWGVSDNRYLASPKLHIRIKRCPMWYVATWEMNTPNTKTLKEYCEEGLQAYRIISALNLAK